MSGVRCQVSVVKFFFLQFGRASGWRVCYQRGLTRLVLRIKTQKSKSEIPLKLARLYSEILGP